MTRALALELEKDNVMVNAICPGPFLTLMNEPTTEGEEAEKFIVAEVAPERWGRMDEIQGTAIFLSSDAYGYVLTVMAVGQLGRWCEVKLSHL